VTLGGGRLDQQPHDRISSLRFDLASDKGATVAHLPPGALYLLSACGICD
jgi:hypothetical protein